MEIRVLEYFLAVAREQNISRAAEHLHITQPTLSRQLKELENEFGKQLLIRGKRKVSLTEDGTRFRKMADEIVSLAKRAEIEMKKSADTPAGDIYIGTGESIAIQNIVQTAKFVQEKYPGIHFHFTSGDTLDLTDRLDKGLFDFCIFYEDIYQSKYEQIDLPYTEQMGLLMLKELPLAKKETIYTSDLWNIPLIISRNSMSSPSFFRWIGKSAEELNISNTTDLVYTAMLMAKEKMGYVLTLDNLVNTEGTDLCFKPVLPHMDVKLSLVWKKYRPQSKAAEKFIDELTKRISLKAMKMLQKNI